MAHYLVTGGAGFIGSNMVLALLERGETVRVLDDLSTGNLANLEPAWKRIEFIEGTLLDEELLARAFENIEFCIHLAAIPSVPRSVANPRASNDANVTGSLNIFVKGRDAGVRRIVYASSSSVYGQTNILPLHEGLPRNPISPYGVTKAAAELYAETFSNLYGTDIVGLRYFNVFGERQAADSSYAAVIPKFIRAMRSGERPTVHGDGCQARDFTYVENVVLANIAACAAPGPLAGVYNVACGSSTSILELVALLNEILGTSLTPDFEPSRLGDIRDSMADIRRARAAFGYEPRVSVREGLERTVAWYAAGGERP